MQVYKKPIPCLQTPETNQLRTTINQAHFFLLALQPSAGYGLLVHEVS
jgi:hypothetical protein